MPNYAIFHNTTRLVIQVKSSNITPPAGYTTRLLSTPEFNLIDNNSRAGLRSVVDGSNLVRVATAAETDDGFTPEQYLLKRIPEMLLANRAAAYEIAAPVLFALKAKDKDGAKAIVDASALVLAAKTKLKSLIDNVIL
jgi:hypothetical protein